MTPKELADRVIATKMAGRCYIDQDGMRAAVLAAIREAVAAEREACARLVEDLFDGEDRRCRETIVAAIRGRPVAGNG